MKVIIAGAGLGGLCLAHGLRQAGAEVQVLERRPSSVDQPASYGIHLNGRGLRALRACLPAANWEQLVGAAVPAPDVVRFWDQRLRTLAVIDHEVRDADPELHRRAVSRGALRDALLHGLAGQLPAALTDGSVNNVVPAGPGWMFVSTWRIDVGQDSTGPDRGAAGFFLVWAWAADRASYPAGVDAFSPERLRDLVAARIAGWAPALRGLVAATDPGTIAPVRCARCPR